MRLYPYIDGIMNPGHTLYNIDFMDTNVGRNRGSVKIWKIRHKLSVDIRIFYRVGHSRLYLVAMAYEIAPLYGPLLGPSSTVSGASPTVLMNFDRDAPAT